MDRFGVLALFRIPERERLFDIHLYEVKIYLAAIQLRSLF